MIGAWCNGERVDGFATASRAAHYGDGAFTTIRVHAGQPCWWPAHVARLRMACAALQLVEPDFERVARQVDAALLGVDSAVVKVLLVPIAADRGYGRAWPSPVDVLVLVYAAPLVDGASYRDGVVLEHTASVLADAEPTGSKTLARQAQVLAAPQRAGHEWLLCDRDGFIGSARSANLFAQFGELLVTPPAGRGVIAGVARAQLLQSPPPGFSARVQPMHRDALLHADAVILSNAVRGFVPVARFGAAVYARRDAIAAVQRRFHAELGLPEA